MAKNTNEEGHAPIAPSPRQLFWVVGAAALAATIVFVAAILPAEFRIDPTGIGRFLGLDRLAGPAEVQVAAVVGPTGAPATFSDVPFRTDTVDIPLKRGGTLFMDELEWKVRMKEGATMMFSWSVPEVTEDDAFYYSFHGQSEPVPNAEKQEIKVTTFKEDVGTKLSGTLIAPYDGLWGWYLQNQFDTPVVVKLNIAGYYEIATQDDIAKAAAAVPRGPPPS
jgi:hypothetical protein